MAFGVLFGSLLVALGNHNMQKNRPRDSIKRIVGGLKTGSFVAHPQFSEGIRRGLAGMGKRLWTPRWITTAVDVWSDGLLWNLNESPFGFESVLIRWSDMKRVRTAKRGVLHLPDSRTLRRASCGRADRQVRPVRNAEQMRLQGVAVNG